MTLLAGLVYAVLCMIGVTSCTTPIDPAHAVADWAPRPLQVGTEQLSVLMPDDGPTVEPADALIDGCTQVEGTEISRADAANVQFVLVPRNCNPPRRQLGNGYPGYFRTVADVPDPSSVRHISTPVGAADVVTYDYYECTNSCTHGSLTAAIITLDSPADADYPTLQVFQPLALSNGEEADVDIAQYAAAITRA